MYSSSVRNIFARLKAQLIRAIEDNGEKTPLPKAVKIILDDDVIRLSHLPTSEIKNGEFNIIVKYLLKEFHCLICSYKDKLLKKAKLDNFPHCVWIVPPKYKYFANNLYRDYFATALESQVEVYHNMCALQLKKVWDEEDGSLYMHEQRRFTQQGYCNYWRAINAAIKFWDKTLREIMVKRQRKNPLQEITCHPKVCRNPQNHTKRTHDHRRLASSNRTHHRHESRHRSYDRAISPPNYHWSKYVWHKERNLSEMQRGRRLPTPPSP